MRIAKFVGMMLLLTGTILTVSAAYAASITMASTAVRAIGGTGQVTINCPMSVTCSITAVSWTINAPGTAAPTVTGLTLTFGSALSGTTANLYTVYVTLWNGVTVQSTGSVAGVTGTSTSASITTLSASTTPSQVTSIEVDIVQTA
jgi:hypothetical protein